MNAKELILELKSYSENCEIEFSDGNVLEAVDSYKIDRTDIDGRHWTETVIVLSDVKIRENTPKF